jgi:hypothetical protein
MIFDRKIKDYYCERCKKSLEDLKEPEEPPKEEKSREEPTPPMKPPDVGTVKGVLFIMIGSIIQLIAPFMAAFGCQIISIVGLFLIILGFYLVFQDRKRYSKNHISNIKFAAIIFIIYILINITAIVLSYYIITQIVGDIASLSQSDLIPESILLNYYENAKNQVLIMALTTGLLAIFQYLTIKELIEIKFKKILAIIVLIIIIVGFGNTFISLNFMNKEINHLEDTTKEQFQNLEFQFNQTELEDEVEDIEFYISYAVFFAKIAAEALIILFYYWTYVYQRNKQSELI